jgi:anti-sigma regulatory factor (Ser/Thr protein kinase)
VSAHARAHVPASLPQREAVHFDAAQRPAVDGASGRADWYDVFALPDGGVGFSLGDVDGSRVRAEHIATRLREFFRAGACAGNRPAAMLDDANAIVNGEPHPIMVSATVGVVDGATARVTYATAGNPAPLFALPCSLLPSLPGGELPLGASDVLGALSWSFSIPPGADFVAYTPGLAHGARNGDVATALRAEIVERGDAPAHALLRRLPVTTGESPATAVVVRAVDRPGPLRLAFSAVPLAVPIARRTLLRYAERLGLDDERRYALITAAGEALANAVEHAYAGHPGLVYLAAESGASTLRVSVRDDGGWKPTKRSEERGRGLPIMRALMDAVDVRTDRTQTTVDMMLYTSPRA